MEAAAEAYEAVEPDETAYAGDEETAYAGDEDDYSHDPIDTVANCRAIDGDTLNCGGERIRLLGIDAKTVLKYRGGLRCDVIAPGRLAVGDLVGTGPAVAAA